MHVSYGFEGCVFLPQQTIQLSGHEGGGCSMWHYRYFQSTRPNTELYQYDMDTTIE